MSVHIVSIFVCPKVVYLRSTVCYIRSLDAVFNKKGLNLLVSRRNVTINAAEVIAYGLVSQRPYHSVGLHLFLCQTTHTDHSVALCKAVNAVVNKNTEQCKTHCKDCRFDSKIFHDFINGLWFDVFVSQLEQRACSLHKLKHLVYILGAQHGNARCPEVGNAFEKR